MAAAFDKVQEGTKAQAEASPMSRPRSTVGRHRRGGFDGFSQRLRANRRQLRGKVARKLEEIRSGNEANSSRCA